jgi:hypothetical protein
MSFSPKRLAAIFYLPLDAASRGLFQLATEAGATKIRAIANDDGTLDCSWGGLDAKAGLIPSNFYCILVISFWQSKFLQLVTEDESAEAKNESFFLQNFQKACKSLIPEFAFIATHLDQATQDWIVGQEWSVLNHAANQLASQGLGLLYFSPEMNDHWTPSSKQEDREILTMSTGRFIFAGRGQSRWFG